MELEYQRERSCDLQSGVQLFGHTTPRFRLCGFFRWHRRNGKRELNVKCRCQRLGLNALQRSGCLLLRLRETNFPTCPAPLRLQFGFTNVVTGSVASGNGDDAYGLFNGNDLVDEYGVSTVDGTGEAWEVGFQSGPAFVAGCIASYTPPISTHLMLSSLPNSSVHGQFKRS